MTEVLGIKGDAPLSPYTGARGWETEAEQGVLVAIAQGLKLESVATWGDIHTGKEYRTKTPLIVEIGSENGMSASIFATFAPDAEIVCIEINEQAHFWHNLQALGLDRKVIPLYGNSATMNWGRESRRLELKLAIDLLFIDGDHSYSGALADLRNFAPYVEKGGYMLLHDCACETNKLPHAQHRDVSEALSVFMKETGKDLGFKRLFTVDSLEVWRRFA